MIYSMTAFARGLSQGDWGNLSVEIKTVNHRYLEIAMRLPENFRHLEMTLRALLQQQLTRGKIDFTIKFQASSTLATTVDVNQVMAKQLLVAALELQADFDLPASIAVTDILRIPGVVRLGEADTHSLNDTVLALTKKTILEVVVTREREGNKLQGMIVERLQAIKDQVSALHPLIPQLLDEQKQKLMQRIEALSLDMNHDRVAQELVLLAQRIDVTEEMDRLIVHLNEVEAVLTKGGHVGRRLDFLMQELNREANTLGAKSIAVQSSHASIDMKVLIEQMREQVQNIE
jgi:uncharacterized protein (TIGR00255 family)